jgi:hypothetical protein
MQEHNRRMAVCLQEQQRTEKNREYQGGALGCP